MLTNKDFKLYAIQSGKSINDVKKVYNKAVDEAKSLGKEKDKLYVIEIFEDILGLNEKIDIHKFINRFIESETDNFDEFIEMLTTSDIPLDTRPEMHIERDQDELNSVSVNVENNIEDSENLLDQQKVKTNEFETKEELLKFKKDTDVVLDSDKVENDKKLLVGGEVK